MGSVSLAFGVMAEHFPQGPAHVVLSAQTLSARFRLKGREKGPYAPTKARYRSRPPEQGSCSRRASAHLWSSISHPLRTIAGRGASRHALIACYLDFIRTRTLRFPLDRTSFRVA